MNTFSLKIIACDRVFYDGPCEILKFPGYDGQMAILAHHEKMTTNIEVGELHFRTPDGEEHVAICSDGLLKVKNNEVVVLVRLRQSCLIILQRGIFRQKNRRKSTSSVHRLRRNVPSSRCSRNRVSWNTTYPVLRLREQWRDCRDMTGTK